MEKQARNMLNRKGPGAFPEAAVSVTTGVKVVSSWAKEHNLTSKPLAQRYIRLLGSSKKCAAPVCEIDGVCYASTCPVLQPYFVINHTTSWCRKGAGLPHSAFKAVKASIAPSMVGQAWNKLERSFYDDSGGSQEAIPS
eukprot:10810645-Karenia_brevis.AAC.1